MYYQLSVVFALLGCAQLYSNVEGADPATTTDQLTDNILSRIHHLVVGNSSRRDNPTHSERLDHLSKDILCPNSSKCKTLSPRDSRTLKTLAFLAGLKFGKHFLQGAQVGAGFQNSGSFAASNSLNLFGQVLNTALSVSYGSPLEADDPASPGTEAITVWHDIHVQEPSVAPTSTSEEPATTVATAPETQPSFKAVREDEDLPAMQASSSPLVSHTQKPPPARTSVRYSQPKTKEQLFIDPRKKFLDDHNERFRKLFGHSVKYKVIPQIGIMLY